MAYIAPRWNLEVRFGVAFESVVTRLNYYNGPYSKQFPHLFPNILQLPDSSTLSNEVLQLLLEVLFLQDLMDGVAPYTWLY